jgi:6-phosphogluconate dehydrogenase
MGTGGAGHFVKMVHNGIEYADMQLIAECYHHLRYALNMEPLAIADLFEQWHKGPLSSYLLEISAAILRQPDGLGDGLLLDQISDRAAQKGTGSWTVAVASQLGVPTSLINEAVGARLLSNMGAVRAGLPPLLDEVQADFGIPPVSKLASAVHDALYIGRVVPRGYSLWPGSYFPRSLRRYLLRARHFFDQHDRSDDGGLVVGQQILFDGRPPRRRPVDCL